MKLMLELESLKAVYPSVCALHYAAQFDSKAVVSNF